MSKILKYLIDNNLIEYNNDTLYFKQTDIVADEYNCVDEVVTNSSHIIPYKLFNILDIDSSIIKNEIFFFNNNATALSFLNSNPLLVDGHNLFVVVANYYSKEHIDLLKSNYPYVNNLSLVFPDTVYGLIDKVKSVLYWRGIDEVFVKNSDGNIVFIFEDKEITLPAGRITFTDFKKQYRARLVNNRSYKTIKPTYKYLLDIYKLTLSK